MGITVSLNQNSNDTLLCLIRREEVQNTAEERVRQALLRKMLEEWGYPPSLILVEKSLSQLPCLTGQGRIPKRRIDIISYAKDQSGALFPLLVVECKEEREILLCDNAPAQAVVRQLLGYNYYIGAPFIGVKAAGPLQLYHSGTGQKLECGPSYTTLLKLLP